MNHQWPTIASQTTDESSTLIDSDTVIGEAQVRVKMIRETDGSSAAPNRRSIDKTASHAANSETVAPQEQSPLNANNVAIEAQFGLPVMEYLERVRSNAHGHLIAWDRSSRKPIAEIVGHKIIAPTMDLSKMSPKARDITSDLPAGLRSQLVVQMKERALGGALLFLLVIPTESERQFEEALARGVETVGLDYDTLDRLVIEYHQRGNGLSAEILTAYLDGQAIPVGREVMLWQGA